MSETLHTELGSKIYAWTGELQLDPGTMDQIRNIANLPIVYDHVAVMPDAHKGIGACVGTVIPTKGALIPAAVGVDIGCGMSYSRLDVKADQLEALPKLRRAIESVVPVGAGRNGEGDFSESRVSTATSKAWAERLKSTYDQIVSKNPKIAPRNHPMRQLGTLGGGNHFIEVVKDQEGYLGLMLHSGSRGVGNRIGQYFIERARNEAERDGIRLVDRDLAWLSESRPSFAWYIEAMMWAQEYARINRDLMMANVYAAFARHLKWPAKPEVTLSVNCHHNFTEKLPAQDVWLTRKGAVRAAEGDLVIIPGAMGRRSFIARGKGNPLSWNSCSHGAGRVMSRGAAKAQFTEADVIAQTKGLESRKDAGVIDEIPAAYKPIEKVMAAQADLVEPVLELEALLCVKG